MSITVLNKWPSLIENVTMQMDVMPIVVIASSHLERFSARLRPEKPLEKPYVEIN